MTRRIVGISCFLFFTLTLSGCSAVGDKSASLSIIYGTAAILSGLLLIGCIRLIKSRRFWFHLLFTSVLIVNVGYTLLSVSANLQTALWANRIAYLGSVFLPLSMLMIILNVTNTAYKNRLPNALCILAVMIFLLAASPGILPLYYKEVSFAVIDGVSTLVKVYGPLHPVYLVYLVGYFSAMVAVIIRASIKKTVDTTSHAIVLAIAVLVNIGVWLIEQLTHIDFEILSISYIISELFLLGVHLVMNENHRLRELVRQVESMPCYPEEEPIVFDSVQETSAAPERIELFMTGLQLLTPAERSVFDAHIARETSKEIMAKLNIKETTLKYHNKNIYGKLGVSSRKELLEIYKQLKAAKTKITETRSDSVK